MEIRELDRSDYKKVINFAIKGMNFDKYVKNKVLLYLYGSSFWYDELIKATEIYVAYSKIILGR